MTMTIEEAARLGASAGLLAEGEPADIARWPAEARAAFAEQYARGRRTRRVAEGRATITRGEADIPAGATREQLVARFNANDELQREFQTLDSFLGYAQAFESGRARRAVGRVVQGG